MTLLFVENRYKTYFFQPIVQRLRSLGHDIHWIVQNKEFLPSGDFNIHVIDYPKDLKGVCKIDYIENIISSDRQVNHFNKEDTSYFYYYNTKIHAIIKDVMPDLVFGESTTFHELLTIEICKRHQILYLNPSTCRYPTGRFSFYKYDTLEPYSGSDEILNNRIAKDVINQIVNRETMPNYMLPTRTTKTAIIKDKLKKTVAYYKGEKYNTPNPFVKYKIEKQKKGNIIEWDKNAITEIGDSDTRALKILYPLQMQPEANIDVWGKKYRNQTKLIQDIAEVLPDNSVLYVKPNPKSKYELDKEIINIANKRNNVKLLQHITKMDDTLPKVDLVITVTGTIAIECILSNKPVVTLVKTINNSVKNCEFIDDLSFDLSKIVSVIKEGKFPKITNEEKINYINLLNKTSFKGVVSDPISDAYCVSEENIDKLVNAFERILQQTKIIA